MGPPLSDGLMMVGLVALAACVLGCLFLLLLAPNLDREWPTSGDMQQAREEHAKRMKQNLEDWRNSPAGRAYLKRTAESSDLDPTSRS